MLILKTLNGICGFSMMELASTIFLYSKWEETFKHVKRFKTHLANLVKQMDNLRFQPDQIVLSNQRNPNNNMGLTVVPLYYLRKKIDDKSDKSNH